MGKYTFTWEHSANEVLVTGTFDDWQQTVKLDRVNGIFQKEVELPRVHTQYKFVVDGNWCANESAPKTEDGKGGHNNVLTPDDIKEPVYTISSAAPESTTAALAGAVPKEDVASKSDDSIPGAFPLTPPVETPSNEPIAFSVNPIPATDGPGNPIKLAPGEPVPDPSTLTSNTVESTVKRDGEPEEEKVSVAPIPATAGIGNPIRLAPGDKVPDPSTLTSNTVSSTVNTDAESYQKSDALPPQLAPVVLTPEAEREAKGGMFDLPPVTGSLIPESSLPKDLSAEPEPDPGVAIQSAAPTSTTAALAANVPLEPHVPEMVVASLEEAAVSPEAVANPEAVEEKKEVEEELKAKVPEEPAASDNSTTSQIGSAAAAGATATAGAFAAATYAAKEKAAEILSPNGQVSPSPVPEVVVESQKEAHVSPEASANTEAVEEKSAVEQELMAKVPEAPAIENPSTGETGEFATTPSATAEAKETAGSGSETAAATGIPEIVAESQKHAHASPEASANAEAVEEKKGVEAELLSRVRETDEAGEPAPTVTAATSQAAPGLSDNVVHSKPLEPASEPDAQAAVGAASAPSEPEPLKATPEPAENSTAVDSRDVSPMSKQPTTAAEQAEPASTAGAEQSKVEAQSAPETPKKDAPAGSTSGTPASVVSGADDKKKKRRSFFGRIKDKLKN